jgi:hypothetical protein
MSRYRYQFPLPIETEDELRLFLHHAFGYALPDVQVCPDHTTPWRAFADAFFARHRVSVWHSSRGFGGKSLACAMLGLSQAATLKCDVTILGGSGQQSANVHKYMTKSWDYPDAPRQLLAGDPYKMETRLRWGNSIKALLASQASVRGLHPVKLICDEVDEMDLSIFHASLGQPMSKGGVGASIVLSSTMQYPDGTMAEVLRMAAERQWPVYRWCYKESMAGWLDAAEVEAKRNEIPAAMWQSEYDLMEPSSENRAIVREAVSAMFQRSRGDYQGGNGEYLEIEPPEPGAVYQHGADWARSHDWTAIATVRIDCSPARLVAFERLGRRPWPQMVQRFEERIQRYRGEACHDGTGLGDVVDGYLSTPAEKVLLVGRTRSDLLSNYVSLIEKGGIVAPMITHVYREHLYASLSDLYGVGHLPDSICAMALATKGVGVPVLQAADVSWAELQQIWREEGYAPQPTRLVRHSWGR